MVLYNAHIQPQIHFTWVACLLARTAALIVVIVILPIRHSSHVHIQCLNVLPDVFALSYDVHVNEAKECVFIVNKRKIETTV